MLIWYVILLPNFMDLESERQQVEILEGMYWYFVSAFNVNVYSVVYQGKILVS